MGSSSTLQGAIEAAVQADRARIYAGLATLAWQQDEYWREGMERRDRQRAYAMGLYAGLHQAARVVDPELPGLLPPYWQTECDKLGV